MYIYTHIYIGIHIHTYIRTHTHTNTHTHTYTQDVYKILGEISLVKKKKNIYTHTYCCWFTFLKLYSPKVLRSHVANIKSITIIYDNLMIIFLIFPFNPFQCLVERTLKRMKDVNAPMANDVHF